MAAKRNILITGAGSGLGKYLHARFGGQAITRSTGAGDWLKIRRQPIDAIIHCAASAPQTVSPEQLAALFEDNVMLTARLLECNCKYFVYLSSVAVYSTDRIPHREEEKLNPDKARNIYALTKMISESLVRKSGVAALILRPTSLIGAESRMNNVMRLLIEQKPRLTLTPQSTYNFVYYPDCAEFIEKAIDKNLTGVFNLAASENIKISQIAEMTGHVPIYGGYQYDVGDISNEKAARLFLKFSQTSKEVLERFIKTAR